MTRSALSGAPHMSISTRTPLDLVLGLELVAGVLSMYSSSLEQRPYKQAVGQNWDPMTGLIWRRWPKRNAAIRARQGRLPPDPVAEQGMSDAGSSAEGLVPRLPQDVHHGPEREPLGDLLALFVFGIMLGPHVHHVLVVGHGDPELSRVLLAGLLRVVGPVEVVARDGALRARHVAADDEVRGAVVLTDDHVLDRLTRPCHLHAVREVRPPEHGILLFSLLAERLVGRDADNAVDVARLGGATSGVHKENRVLDIALGALEELKVCTVDGVPVLEGHNLLALGQHLAHLPRRLHRIAESRAREAMQPSSHIVSTLLSD
eukprot:CAMPEP_0197944002 /NCGR_PEP_ID=MMETSP1439-20131203/125194_1 /TAXON_ID=66791 /ORGANISM="Gonyaulax spinifera, Strain CCMP409" /LENGTH=317 /DNA_ID=CAMNT_0043567257 /DNA_START=62 /DNA_END=1014 /DNA_ORIENTATION=+